MRKLPKWMSGQNLALDRNASNKLLYLYRLLSVISLFAILLVAGYGTYRVYSAQVMADAEDDANSVGSMILAQERKLLLNQGLDGAWRVTVAREKFPYLDERMHDYLPPFHIYKIKVFSADRTIVYSTDKEIIGRVDDKNPKLSAVLNTGAAYAHLENKEQVRDLGDETRFDVDVVEAYVPIKWEGTTIGSFEVYVDVTPARGKLAKVMSRSLIVLATVLVVILGALYIPMRRAILQTNRALDELQNLANTDVLTGMFNRRFLLSRIREEYSRINRVDASNVDTHASLSLLMIDVDRFKVINDAHGHLVGDEILQQLSVRLTHCLRDYDVIGRYGGEEFLVMLPHTDLDTAILVAERVRQGVRKVPFNVGKELIPVTVSIGIAHSSKGMDDDMFATIHNADKCLYQAKNSGRDCVRS